MARRLVNTTYTSSDNTNWALELWDLDLSSSDLDHIVEMEVQGFNIQWSGDENKIFQPLLSSSCDFTLVLNETQRGVIMDVAYGLREFRMAVKIRRNNQVYWVGQIHSESIIETIEDGSIYVDFTASDGLAQLDNIDFKQNDGSVYTERYSAAAYIYAILLKIPTVGLWYTNGVGSVFMYEHFLNQPVLSTDSFTFNHTGSDGVTRGVLDYLHVDPNTWYLRPPDQDVRGDRFERYPTTKKEGFVSCKEVLHDILASLGATICFSEGTWRIFDRCHLDSTTTSLSSASVIQYARTSSGQLEAGTFTESIDVDLDATSSEFSRGIARKGLQPFAGAGQTHRNAGSDLLFASGIGYNLNENPLVRFKDSQFPTGDGGANVHIHNFAGSSGLDANAVVGGLTIANGGNNGSIRLHFSGNCDYRKFGSGEDCGTLGILSFRFEITDNNDITYRLKRRVRTLKYTSTGATFGVNITGGTGTSLDYIPKFYESDFYTWVASTDSGYSEAQVDIMLGADPSVLNEGFGTSNSFLTQDFPSFAFYTPPGTALDTGSTLDNVLRKDNNATRRFYVYRFDHVLETPTSSATIKSIRMDAMFLSEWSPDNGPDIYYDSSGNGNVIALGTDQGSPNYRTESVPNANDGVYNGSFSSRPNVINLFQLSGLEIYNGDGTNEFDNTTVFTPANIYGNEVYKSPTVSVGGAFENFGTHVYGRYLVSSFSDQTAREDNFKMITAWDSSDAVTRMTQRVNKNVMQIRSRTRQIVEGELFSYTSSATTVEPWQRLVTNKLSGTLETFIPFRVSISFADLSQKLTLMRVRGTTSTVDGSHTDVDKGRGGRAATGGGITPSTPMDIIAPQLTSMSFNATNEITAFNIASGSTPIGADEVDDASTTHKFATATQLQKVDFISVSSSVDLNNISSGGDSSLFGDLFPIFISKK